MSKVRVAGFAVSIDGFGAGPDQNIENPLGRGGPELHNWFYPTQTFRSMLGKDDGTDDRFARATAEGFGAFRRCLRTLIGRCSLLAKGNANDR